ncbi:tripartite motif-containing protein 16-like protein [Engraulis encrasicolus]|uniref:tripartite motif-containing protein 16-like protein n=1 Tax=Engraulis encrasicolus TaxID=184585 RepID=UPI002FD44F66
MAEAAQLNPELFTCPICLDLLKVPVTILCGHSYCKGCLNSFWDQEDPKGVYSCPQCRQTFSPRPVLNKNNIFAQLVEQLRKTIIQEPVGVDSGGPGDVECNVCTGKNLGAFKCLGTRSDSEPYNQLHRDAQSAVDAIRQGKEKMCPRHKQLRDTQRSFQRRILEGEKELQELHDVVETLKSSAQSAVEDTEGMFAEMMRSLERRCSEVTELIRAQEEAEVSRTEALLKKLEQEIAELKRRDAELEELAHLQDDVHFLQTFPSISALQSTFVSTIEVCESLSFEAVKSSVATLKLLLEDVLQQESINISAAVSTRRTVLAEPVTREDFLQYSCPLTLDSESAYKHLHWNVKDRQLEWTNKPLSCRDNPKRFDVWGQVLCTEGVLGRGYWEVEWRGELVHVAVSYNTIGRKGYGNDCGFGFNDQSWSLTLTSSGSSFKHNNEETKLPLVASPRVGVYVDQEAGTLAFYNITSDDSMTLLHKVHTAFTQDLYPGFTLGPFTRSSVKLL